MDTLIEFLVFSGVVLAVTGLLFIRIVGPNEMAIKVVFGWPLGVCKSGLRFLFRFFGLCYLKRYPLTMFDLSYEITAITKKGTYDGEEYGSIEVPVRAVAYLNFPRKPEMLVDNVTEEPKCFLKDLSVAERAELDAHGQVTRGGATLVMERSHPLIKILRANVPTTKEGLQDWTEEAATSAIRAAAAQMTWKEANEAPERVKEKVEEFFMKADGSLVAAGFRPSGIKIAIKVIDLPDGLKDALTGKEAAAKVADKDAEETAGRILKSVARMAGKTVEEVEADLKAHSEKRGKSAEQGGYREYFEYAQDQTKRDRAQEGLNDVRIGNTDGTSFESGSLGSVVGAIAAGVAAASHAKATPKRSGTRKLAKGKGAVQGRKNRSDLDDDDEEDLENELKQREKKGK